MRLFLHREQLFTDWPNLNWKSVIKDSLREWERRQARATASAHPDAAAEDLRAMGYHVVPPSGASA